MRIYKSRSSIGEPQAHVYQSILQHQRTFTRLFQTVLSCLMLGRIQGVKKTGKRRHFSILTSIRTLTTTSISDPIRALRIFGSAPKICSEGHVIQANLVLDFISDYGFETAQTLAKLSVAGSLIYIEVSKKICSESRCWSSSPGQRAVLEYWFSGFGRRRCWVGWLDTKIALATTLEITTRFVVAKHIDYQMLLRTNSLRPPHGITNFTESIRVPLTAKGTVAGPVPLINTPITLQFQAEELNNRMFIKSSLANCF